MFVCAGVSEGERTLWGVRLHPAVPSNGRIELNRLEKSCRLLTHKRSFRMPHSSSLSSLLPCTFYTFNFPSPCNLPSPTVHLSAASPLSPLATSSCFLCSFFILSSTFLSPSFTRIHPLLSLSLSPLVPCLLPPSLSPWRRCNDSYLSVIRGPP